MVYTGTVLLGLGMDDGSAGALTDFYVLTQEVHVTYELDLILSTDVAVGETLKVRAAAGAMLARAQHCVSIPQDCLTSTSSMLATGSTR